VFVIGVSRWPERVLVLRTAAASTMFSKAGIPKALKGGDSVTGRGRIVDESTGL